MPLTIYKGTTKKLFVELLDREKAPINPSSLVEVEASIRHIVTKKEYVKYSTIVKTGYKLATVVDGKVKLVLDTAVTSAMDVGEITIAILIHTTDADFLSGQSVDPALGVLATVKEL